MGRRRRDPELERFWRQAIRGQSRSELSVREYCLAHRLNAASFYGWRTEIARRDGDGEPVPSIFVPVRVVGAEVVELVLPSGVIVRVPALADPAAVARLVAALEATTC